MESVKEFLKPEDKTRQKRNLLLIDLFGLLFIFLVGLVGGLLISGSLLVGFLMAILISVPFLIVTTAIYVISVIGINKEWSSNKWLIVCILMIVVGLLILLLRHLL